MQEQAERTTQALKELTTHSDAVNYRLIVVGLIYFALSHARLHCAGKVEQA
jgi:hypothetical protein